MENDQIAGRDAEVVGEVVQVVPTFGQEYRKPLFHQSLDHIVEDQSIPALIDRDLAAPRLGSWDRWKSERGLAGGEGSDDGRHAGVASRSTR